MCLESKRPIDTISKFLTVVDNINQIFIEVVPFTFGHQWRHYDQREERVEIVHTLLIIYEFHKSKPAP